MKVNKFLKWLNKNDIILPLGDIVISRKQHYYLYEYEGEKILLGTPRCYYKFIYNNVKYAETSFICDKDTDILKEIKKCLKRDLQLGKGKMK